MCLIIPSSTYSGVGRDQSCTQMGGPIMTRIIMLTPGGRVVQRVSGAENLS